MLGAWGIWRSYYNIPKAIFHLLKGTIIFGMPFALLQHDVQHSMSFHAATILVRDFGTTPRQESPSAELYANLAICPVLKHHYLPTWTFRTAWLQLHKAALKSAHYMHCTQCYAFDFRKTLTSAAPALWVPLKRIEVQGHSVIMLTLNACPAKCLAALALAAEVCEALAACKSGKVQTPSFQM